MNYLPVTLQSSVQAGFSGRDGSLKQLITKLQLTNKQLIEMEQVHGDGIAVIASAITKNIPQVDSVLTTNPNLMLAVRTADCLPVLLAHPTGLIGAMHAGRKSTELKIVQKTLEIARDEFGVQKDLSLWLGPHICEQCYQINRELDLHFNLLSENLAQINSVYDPSQVSIQISKHCTAHQTQHFYSYRKEGAGVPMNYSVITSASMR
jgi:copper oxidase (laccase) domain-containing protein